jgi:hypothetical protein
VFAQLLTAGRFIRDFHRWRSVLQTEGDQLLYDEVVCSVWNLPHIPSNDSDNVSSYEDNIARLADLVSTLASQTGFLADGLDGDAGTSGGYRLHSMRQSYLTNEPETYERENRRRGECMAAYDIARDKPPDEYEDGQSKIDLEKSRMIATILMAGAVFSVILFFLSGKYLAHI